MPSDALKYGYVWEKFYNAVRGMSSSEEHLQQRLANAYLYHLGHLERHEIPPDIEEEFRALSGAMRRNPGNAGEGSVNASTSRMDELEVRELIASIVSMYDHVAKYGPNR